MKEKIKKYIKELSQRKLVKNFLLIFTGQGISSIFGIISTMIIVGGIGSEKHGILIVVQTYATLFYSFFSFKTFQALIKYLAQAKKDKNKDDVKLYIKWSLVFDVCSLILMFIAGILLRNPVIKLMGWPEEMKKYVVLYLITQVFYIQGTTIGVLRSYEKYNYVVIGQVITNVVRCIGYGICLLFSKNFVSFLIAEMVAVMTNNILLIYYTYKVLKQEKLLDFYKVKLKNKKDFLVFNIYSNLTSTLDLPINQVTQLIINKYLGFAANSAYNVFEKLGTVINKLGDPINQIIYPEMSVKVVEKDYEGAKKISMKLKKLMLGIFVVTALGTILTYPLWFHFFIDDVNKYIGAFILYLAFISYVNAAMGTHNLFMALGYVKYNIPILIVVNTVYLIFLFFSIQSIGLVGVISAYIIQAFGMVMIKEFIMKKNNYRECLGGK